LRETDLYDYQRQLDKADESRIDHNFVDKDGNFADLYVQRVSFLDLGDFIADFLDITLSYSTKLWIHLLSYGLFRASLRGASPRLQPAPDSTSMSR